MTNDLSIKVTVACKDGDWTARSPVYSFYGLGASPEDALDDFAAEVRKFYTGAKFAPRDNRPLEVSYVVKQVQTDVLVRIIEETPLDAFGVDCGDNDEEECTDTALLEGECTPLLEAPRAPEHYALSFDKTFIENLLVSCSDAIIIPFVGGQHIQSGDFVWLYERKESSGNQAFMCVFIVDEVLTLHSSTLSTPEWVSRHGLLAGDIVPGEHIVVTFNYGTMRGVPPSGIAVPEGEIAPRGCNWLRPAYVRKLEEAIDARHN